jgi:NHL repeat
MNTTSIRRTGTTLAAVMAISVLIGVLAPAALASEPMTFVQMIGKARMTAPQGVAVNSDGDVYVSDQVNANAVPGDNITKYDADGNFIDVIAGPGSTAGKVFDPAGLAVAPNDDLYSVEVGTDRVQHWDALGNFLGTWGGFGSGNGQFFNPRGISVDSLGNVYVADTGNDRVQKFDSSGNWITAWTATAPVGVAVDSTDVVWVLADTQIQRFNTSGSPLSSFSTGIGAGLAVDASNHAWMTQNTGFKSYDSAGTLLGAYGAAGTGDGQFTSPKGIAAAPDGRIYVADQGKFDNLQGAWRWGRMQRFSAAGAYQAQFGRFPGPGVMDYPYGVGVGPSDVVYVTNQLGDEIQKFDSSGNLVIEFGTAGNANGQLNDPRAVAVASGGNVYVADTKNERIQEFNSSGGYIRQWGSYGTNDGQVRDPEGIAVDGSGNVYVADTLNDRIQKFSSTGTFLLTWGSLGTGDGQFKDPIGIDVDGAGHVWVADSSNHRVQEFASDGTFLTKWGSVGTGDGELTVPTGIAVDGEGTVWVSDQGNRLQRFSTSGGFLATMGTTGLRVAQFDTPGAIAFDSTGRLLVADTNNHRVQVFKDENGPDTTVLTGPPALSGSTSATFTFQANEPGSTYQCKLDGGVYAACTSPKTYNGLAETSHTFSVKATDTLSNPGNPTVYPWTVDVTPPVTHISSTPPALTASTAASFSFNSSEQNSTFQCWTDTDSPASCSSPDNFSVTNGAHTFHVEATDQAGNLGAAATYSWTVDTTPPDVNITAGPTGTVNTTTATFKFTSPDATATFECRLDGLAFAACTSPKSYTSLAGGAHTFAVRGTDSLGNVSTPVQRTWSIDTSIHRPDAMIATGTTYIGNNVYNSTGASQTKSLKCGVGKTVVFKIRIQNDGNVGDSFSVRGPGTGSGYAAGYFDGTNNISASVVGGSYNVTLQPTKFKVLTLRVTVLSSSAVASRSFLVKFTAIRQTTKVDAVKAVVNKA